MAIAQIVAGWTLGKADILRRYMSKKRDQELAEMKPDFIEGAAQNGYTAEDVDWLFEQLMPFAKYGFNKSHAAAYSFVAYVTAWAKCYYPAEYLCAAMTEQGNKTLQFISDCKKFGIEVRRVDINMSNVDYTTEGENVIRIGFAAIKGLKNEAANIVESRKDGAFKDIRDFVVRTNLKKNSYEAIVLSGACDSYTNNRLGAMTYIESLTAINADVQKCAERLAEIEESVPTTPTEEKAKTRLLTQWENKLEAAKVAFDNCSEMTMLPLSVENKLAYESEYLGMWTTGSPLEDYDLSNYKSVEEVEDSHDKIAGVITGLRVFETRTGQKMATFTLLDKDSTAISAVVFANQFEELESVIANNVVVAVKGDIGYRNGGNDDEDELQIKVYQLETLSAKLSILTITVPTMMQFAALQELLLQSRSNNGIQVRVFDWNNQIRDVRFPVSEAIVAELKTCGLDYEARV